MSNEIELTKIIQRLTKERERYKLFHKTAIEVAIQYFNDSLSSLDQKQIDRAATKIAELELEIRVLKSLLE